MGVADNATETVQAVQQPEVVLIEGEYKTVVCRQAPVPEAPSSLPTPSERRGLEKEKRSKEMEDRETGYKERKEEYQKKEKKSFSDMAQAKLGSLSHKVDKLKTDATHSLYDKCIDKMDKSSEERFKKSFPDLVASEKLVDHYYPCVLVNEVTTDGQQHKLIEGFLGATEGHLLFTASHQQLAFRVSLKDVVSVRKAIKLETKGPSPHCMLLPVPEVIAQGVLIYTKQGHVHRLFKFEPAALSSTAEDAFGVIDHVWRGANPVIPLPDYQYAA